MPLDSELIDRSSGHCLSIDDYNKTNKENANNRYWPVDHLNRYDNRNHQKRTRNNRRYKNHRHQPYPYCTQCTARPQMQASGNTIRDIAQFK